MALNRIVARLSLDLIDWAKNISPCQVSGFKHELPYSKWFGHTFWLMHTCMYSRFCVIRLPNGAIRLVSTSWGELLVSYLFARTFFLKVELVFSNDHFCWDQTLFIGHRNVAGKTPFLTLVQNFVKTNK